MVLLLRYSELGLKSTPVRRRFTKKLISNISEHLVKSGTEALIDETWGRILIRASDEKKAVDVLSRVFGLASISIAVECSSDRDDIKTHAISYCEGKIRKNSTFAVRARRDGTHPYSSQELAAFVGGSIHDVHEKNGLRVDLSNPDFTLYIEVRGKAAYIFTDTTRGPGGMPIGTQGRAAALIRDEDDALAAWLVMKRGCSVYGLISPNCDRALIGTLGKWDTRFRFGHGNKADLDELLELAREIHADAIIVGSGSGEIILDKTEVPLLYPTVALGDSEKGRILKTIHS